MVAKRLSELGAGITVGIAFIAADPKSFSPNTVRTRRFGLACNSYSSQPSVLLTASWNAGVRCTRSRHRWSIHGRCPAMPRTYSAGHLPKFITSRSGTEIEPLQLSNAGSFAQTSAMRTHNLPKRRSPLEIFIHGHARRLVNQARRHCPVTIIGLSWKGTSRSL